MNMYRSSPSPVMSVRKHKQPTSASTTSRRSMSSSFRDALVKIPVPSSLLEGVHVLRVHANGKTSPSFLTISEDKFTLYVTSQKVNKREHTTNGVSWFRRNSKHNDAYTERAIDVGAIDRVQRGQATHKFELAKKHRPDLRHSSASPSNKKSSTSSVSDDYSILFFDPTRSFSIIFRGERTSLDLMMMDDNNTTSGDDQANRDRVLDALDHILQTYNAAKRKVANDVLLLRYIWLDVDKDKTNTINQNDLGKVLERINFSMRKAQLHQTYEKFGKTIGLDRSQRRKGLSFEQACTLLHKIKRDTWMVKPVNVLWNELFGEFMNNGKPRMTVSDRTFLQKFVHEKQGETNVTLGQVQKLFQRLQKLEIAHTSTADAVDLSNPNRIDKDRFEAYLLGRENDAFDPLKERFDQRLMTKPISEYWISTSHNTYLTGDQFTSHSSVEMYLSALYRGCRCLELDCWDGEWENDKPIPVVWHGHTMTTKILFVDIIQAIKVYLNFNPSVFPIVLSFENHCSIPFQQVMAKRLVEILGGRLYIPTESSLFGRLPSPQDLRGMVVIKGRRPDGTVGADVDDSDDDTDDEGQQKIEDAVKVDIVKKHRIAPELAKLTLFHGTKYKDWNTSIMNPTHHMHSFVESKVKSLCRNSKSRRDWSIYNQSHMTRTFPAGSRVDSSNYNPLLAWSSGCQLVALNFQTPDSHMRLNDGRFRENGGCGYVLKPSALMVKDDFTASIPILLTVRVLSGSCLPKPRGEKTGECIDPYVKVSVYDLKNGERETCTSFSTNVVPSNGFFPIWNAERFLFTVENGTVAMLQLSVYDKDVVVATASIPVSCLRQGYRSVQLFDSKNTRSGAFDFASLLIEVDMRRVVAEI